MKALRIETMTDEIEIVCIVCKKHIEINDDQEEGYYECSICKKCNNFTCVNCCDEESVCSNCKREAKPKQFKTLLSFVHSLP